MIPPRLIAYGLAGAALLGGVFWFSHARYTAGEAAGDARAAAAESARDQAIATLQTERAERARLEKASHDYQTELAGLRAQPVVTTPVRLCRPAARVPAAATAAGGPGAAVPAAGVVPSGTGTDLVAGPDLGPGLRALARRADEVSAQGRAIQGLAPPQ